MTVELDAKELEVLIRAVEDHKQHRRTKGLSTDEADALVRKLEAAKSQGQS